MHGRPYPAGSAHWTARISRRWIGARNASDTRWPGVLNDECPSKVHVCYSASYVWEDASMKTPTVHWACRLLAVALASSNARRDQCQAFSRVSGSAQRRCGRVFMVVVDAVFAACERDRFTMVTTRRTPRGQSPRVSGFSDARGLSTQSDHDRGPRLGRFAEAIAHRDGCSMASMLLAAPCRCTDGGGVSRKLVRWCFKIDHADHEVFQPDSWEMRQQLSD